ncbi:LytR C-terminal domain-containing protein [Actinomyces sp. B33]|uniref:LytR C-terminal domain-containing protein n=1 Tax=Actinomyces sp. B33 TaxID=2942131 RepID=UPI0023401165|nr:LytR C-terminal domain-containing protein [Actinomyces sp. B33]MDC4232225.1 LytR C-terminal domain-containing protein [Actinomyces sp. B33]
MSAQYPKDEFDRAGDDMPIGMHRAQPSKWKNVWPFLALLVIVPLLGWGVSTILTNRGIDAGSLVPSAQAPQSAPAQPAAPEPQSSPAQSAASERDEDSRREEPQSAPDEAESAPETSPADEVDHNAVVSVLNGTGIQGLAADRAGTLTGAGFVAVSAANAQGWQTEVSTVYYEDPAMRVTAEAVGEALGIANVQATTGLGNPDVVVILR